MRIILKHIRTRFLGFASEGTTSFSGSANPRADVLAASTPVSLTPQPLLFPHATFLGHLTVLIDFPHSKTRNQLQAKLYMFYWKLASF